MSYNIKHGSIRLYFEESGSVRSHFENSASNSGSGRHKVLQHVTNGRSERCFPSSKKERKKRAAEDGRRIFPPTVCISECYTFEQKFFRRAIVDVPYEELFAARLFSIRRE